MRWVLTIFLTLCSLLSAAEDVHPPRTEIPDPFPVFTEVHNVYIDGTEVRKREKTHEIKNSTKADWVKQYGPLTEADRIQYVQFGALRRSIIIHHVTL